MIETERLILMPLTHPQLVKYSEGINLLEDELQLKPSSRLISPELKEALENTILPNVADAKKNYLFNTLWTVISKHEQTMVGDICLLGEPNAAGEIEIGYGTYDKFRNRGYMTEAVGGIVLWADGESSVNSILASTEKTNIASFSILKKNKFIKSGETETLFHWKFVMKQYIPL